MFKECLSQLTDVEREVYEHIEDLRLQGGINFSIRALAEECHVSKSTILRLCHKLGYSGYQEFKESIQEHDKSQNIALLDEPLMYLQKYSHYLQSNQFIAKQKQAVNYLQAAEVICFFGVGNSGAMACYAERYFSNLGYLAFSSVDPFKEMQVKSSRSLVAVMLSVSGNTGWLVKQIRELRKAGVKIISITSNQSSIMASYSDVALTYPVFNERKDLDSLDFTTQVPVTMLIENLARACYATQK